MSKRQKGEKEKLLRRKAKAESERNALQIATSCIELAEYYYHHEDYEQAISEYKNAANYYQQLDKKLEFATAHRMISEMHVNTGKYKLSLQHVEIYLKIVLRLDNKEEEQRAYATLGHVYLNKYISTQEDQEDLTLAYNAFMKSLKVSQSLTGIVKESEQMKMMARLYSNLGVCKEYQGKCQAAIDLLQKSIHLFKEYNYYNELHRVYELISNIFSKLEDYSNAVNNINLAIEAAELVKNTKLLCSSLVQKSGLLIKMADFPQAKAMLKRAYRLKTPDKSEYEKIKKHLKIVIMLCQTEDTLLLTAEHDYTTRRKLYERMGDGATALENFSKAVEYYKKMLEATERKGFDERELSACYNSLALTYKDMDQYESAVEYFQRYYDLSLTSAKDKIDALFHIVEVMERNGKTIDDLIKVYTQARSLAREHKDKHLEGKVLSRFIHTLKKFGRLSAAIPLESDLDTLDYSTSESECSDAETSINHYETIDLSDLSGGSDDDSKRQKKPPSLAMLMKRNAKGETPLHRASISGNTVLVRKLIEQGHTVNVRDFTGWLPLHEACNHGNLDVVQILVQNGAAINDRGGAGCEGMSPIHDAAENGHLSIVEYLLNAGASPLVRNNNRQTPLHVLRAWRDREGYLDPTQEDQFEKLVARLTSALKKAGQTDFDIPIANKENSALILVNNVESNSQPVQPNIKRQKRYDAMRRHSKVVDDDDFVTSPKKSNQSYTNNSDATSEYSRPNAKSQKRYDAMRRYSSLMDDDDDSEDFVASPKKSNQSYANNSVATSEYISAMNNLKNRPSQASVNILKKRKSSSALMSPDEVGDDWLDDDLAKNKRKKTLNSLNCIIKKKPKVQSNLIKSGFTRQRSVSPVTLLVDDKYDDAIQAKLSAKRQPKISNFMQQNDNSNDSIHEVIASTSIRSSPVTNSNRSPVTASSYPTTFSNILNVDVRIDGKLFRVPVPSDQLTTLNIRWLNEESVKRFYKREGSRPTIQLETQNGAILCEDDVIGTLFAANDNSSGEIQATIIKWNDVTLLERYKYACSNLKMDEYRRIVECLEHATNKLHIQNENLGDKIHPLCVALKRQTNLVEINLSGNFIGDTSIEMLCEGLAGMHQLRSLNLSLNNLSGKTIKQMVQCSEFAPSLAELDLSFNPLGADCLMYLAMLTQRCAELRTLRVCNVDFDINSDVYYKELRFDFDQLEVLDISNNQMNGAAICYFINQLKPTTIRELDVSNNLACNAGEIANSIINLLGDTCDNVLEILNVSGCNFGDQDIQRLILIAKRLHNLDVSFNTALTSNALKFIVEHSQICSLNLNGCENLSEHFAGSIPWTPAWQQNCNRTLYTTLDNIGQYEITEYLKNIYSRVGGKLEIDGLEDGVMNLFITEH